MARSTTMDFMHPLISKLVERRTEMCQLQAGLGEAGRPATFSIEPTQPTPTPGGDQERPREGRRQTEGIPCRPAYGRPAGPTLQCLELIFSWKLHKPTLLHTLDTSAKYRPLTSINRPPSPYSLVRQTNGVLSSHFCFLE